MAKTSGTIPIDLLIFLIEEIEKSFQELGTSIDEVNEELELARAIQIRSIDAFRDLEIQLQQVVGVESDLVRIQEELLTISNSTRSELAATVDAYASLARGASQYGVSQGHLLKVTESVNQAVKLSSSSPEAAAEGIAEFEAALLLGRVSAENFEKILRTIPELGIAIAAGLDGRTPAQALELIETEGLSAQQALDALGAQANVLDERFATLKTTIQEFRTVSNNAELFSVGRESEREGDTQEFLDDAAELASEAVNKAAEFREFNSISELYGIYSELSKDLIENMEMIEETESLLREKLTIKDRNTLEKKLNALEIQRIDLIEKFNKNLDSEIEKLNDLLQQIEDFRSRPAGRLPDGTSAPDATQSGSTSTASGGVFFASLLAPDMQGAAGQDQLFGRADDDALSRPFIDSAAAIEAWADQIARAAAEVSGASLPTISEALDENLVGGLEDAKAQTQETHEETGQLFDDVAGRAIDRLADEIVDLSLDMDSLKKIGRLALEELKSGLEDLARESLEEVLRLLKEIILQFIQVEILGQQMSATQGGAGNGGANSKGTFFSLLGTVIGAAFSGGSNAPSSTGQVGSGAGGGINQGGFGGGRILSNAEGGTIPIGRTSFVGEAGPELAMAGAAGTRIMPLRRPSLPSQTTRSGGEMIVINQSFDFSRADMNTVGQLRAESERIKRESVALMRSEVLKGGSLARDIGKR